MRKILIIILALMILNFAVSSQEALHVDSAGNVGINTTTPTEKLEVNGNAKVTGNLTVVGDLSVGTVDTIQEDTQWHEIGQSGNPAFENSWVNYGLEFNTAAFRKDAMGFIHLKGLVKGGIGNTIIFALPLGYRPASIYLIPRITNINSDYLVARVDIYPDGRVIHKSPSSSGWVTLDNIIFFAGN